MRELEASLYYTQEVDQEQEDKKEHNNPALADSAVFHTPRAGYQASLLKRVKYALFVKR
jgi:hypothetical protein